jgi:hypothetical protein
LGCSLLLQFLCHSQVQVIFPTPHPLQPLGQLQFRTKINMQFHCQTAQLFSEPWLKRRNICNLCPFKITHKQFFADHLAVSLKFFKLTNEWII